MVHRLEPASEFLSCCQIERGGGSISCRDQSSNVTTVVGEDGVAVNVEDTVDAGLL